MAICLKTPAGDVCLRSRRGNCTIYFALSLLCTAPCAGWVSKESDSSIQCFRSSGQLQLAQAAEDLLVELAAKFPVAAVLPVFLGSC